MSRHTHFDTSLELFRQLNIMFYSLLGGMFLFLIVAVIIRNPDQVLVSQHETVLAEYILLILIIFGISGAYIFYIAGTKKVTEQSPLTEKVRIFHRSSIVKLALFEGAGMCGLTGYVISAYPLYLGIGLVIIMLMLLHKPTPRRLVVEFKLTREERDIVQTGKPFDD
jgi:hypothetical protein